MRRVCNSWLFGGSEMHLLKKYIGISLLYVQLNATKVHFIKIWTMLLYVWAIEYVQYG